ncbi:11885_t:CDS:2, partial [Gigaspora margarita]
MSNEVIIASQNLQISKTTPDNNNRARRKLNTENAKVGQAKNVKESSRLKRRIIKHGELAVINREKKRQYSRESNAKTYGTITRRRKSEELQNNKGIPVELKKNKTDAAQHNMDEEINLFLEEQKNIFRSILRVNSSQLQNTKEDTRAHNSSTVKINRICKGKDKEIIAESSKK